MIRRKVFDKFLSEQPLHLTTLAELEIKVFSFFKDFL